MIDMLAHTVSSKLRSLQSLEPPRFLGRDSPQTECTLDSLLKLAQNPHKSFISHACLHRLSFTMDARPARPGSEAFKLSLAGNKGVGKVIYTTLFTAWPPSSILSRSMSGPSYNPYTNMMFPIKLDYLCQPPYSLFFETIQQLLGFEYH